MNRLWSLLVALPLCAAGADYYADAINGEDSRSGTSPAEAWRSLEKINATVFQPGDRLWLRSGSVWTGTLRPQGSGAEGRPIVLDRYGAGSAPVIHGGGAEAALLLSNQEFWDVRHLEFTNDAPAEGLRRGVLVRAENMGRALRGIRLLGLYVHHVKGRLGADIVSKTTGGIGVEVRSGDRPSRFDGLVIENCRVEHVDSTGIYTWSGYSPHPRDPLWEQLRFTNVIVRGNSILDTGKNAMGVRASLAPRIERNTVRNSSARLHGNAIYVFGCQDALIQYNEVSGTRFDRIEGAAFDSDYNSSGTIIQFNHSYANGGGLVNLCNNPASRAPRGFNHGTIVRNNVSRDEISRVIGFDGPVTHTLIENNTIYVPKGGSPQIVVFDIFGQSPGFADGVLFRGNTIINEGAGTYHWGGATNVVFENNSLLGRQPANAPPSGDLEFRPAVGFARRGEIELKADLYLPRGAGPFAAVVYIHGGGWSGGERTQLRHPAAYLAARGVAAAAIDYRLSGQAQYPAALEDCLEAVRWLRANAGQYRIDPARIAAAGSSAGGHLAALLGVTARGPDKLRAVVALNPVLDLTAMDPRSASIQRFLGAPCADAQAVCEQASPYWQATAQAPPFLIAHGTADQIVPYAQAEAMAAKLTSLGVPVRLFTAEEGPHTFWANPRWLPGIQEAMESFLKLHLR